MDTGRDIQNLAVLSTFENKSCGFLKKKVELPEIFVKTWTKFIVNAGQRLRTLGAFRHLASEFSSLVWYVERVVFVLPLFEQS